MIPAGATSFILGFVIATLASAANAGAFSIADAWQRISFPEHKTRAFYRAESCLSGEKVFLACVRGLNEALKWANPVLRLLPAGLARDRVAAGPAVHETPLWWIAPARSYVRQPKSGAGGISEVLSEQRLIEEKWKEIYPRMAALPKSATEGLIDTALAFALGETRPLPATWPERREAPDSRILAELFAQFDGSLRDGHFQLLPKQWADHLQSAEAREEWHLPFKLLDFGSQLWVASSSVPLLQAGDQLLSIDGRPVAGLDEEALDAIFTAHPAGLRFVFRNFRSSSQVTLFEKPVRVAESAFSIEALPGFPRVGWVRLRRLEAKGISTQIRNALKESQGRFDAWVLDIRNNPGGLLSEAALVASLFAPDRDPVIRLVAPTPTLANFLRRMGQPVEAVFSVFGDPTPLSGPVVVLVNRRTASAAEALAGALQGSGHALVLGSLTFGKGASLLTSSFSEGLAYLKTTHEVEAGPERLRYHGAGIRPNLEFPVDELVLGEREFFPASVLPFRAEPAHSEPPVLRSWKTRCALPALEGTPDALLASAGELLQCRLRLL